MAPVSADPTTTVEPIEQFRHDEAALALTAGDFDRARHIYQIILRTSPEDLRAAREAARAAHAMGRFDLAIPELRHAIALLGDARDPELYYLLGEALYARGLDGEALRMHDLAEEQIGGSPTDRMPSLWLARIYARRGELDRAETIYRQLAGTERNDAEVMLSWAEAHILNGQWSSAEKILRHLLAVVPTEARGRDMLAWVLEARGKLEQEQALRAEILGDQSKPDFRRTIDHGRALERAGNFRAALQRYREAYELAPEAPGLSRSIDRMTYRLTPEAAVGALYHSDPSGTSYELRTGMAVPLGSEFGVALTFTFGTAEGTATTRSANGGTVTGAFAAGYSTDFNSVFRVSANYRTISTSEMAADEDDSSIGAGVELRLAQGRAVQGHLRADLHMPWREAANTIREGGTYDGVTAHLYALPFGHRLIFDVGARARQMTLQPLMDDPSSTGDQTMLFGGADYVAWSAPANTARGEILDEELAWSTYLADSLVFSYRHYEAFTDADFGDRIVLSDRDSIDELSSTARKALADGILAVELRGGLGYDWARDALMWRTGSSLLVSPWSASRLTLTYDASRESTQGFIGRRHAGFVSFHVDL